MNHLEFPHYWVNHLGFLIRKQLLAAFVAEGHDISAEEWAVLLILQGCDGLSASEVSDQTLRDKTTISRLISKMVGKGLIDPVQDAQDRRFVRLHLSIFGGETFAALRPIAMEMIARSLRGIAPEEVAATVSTLGRMAANLKAPTESEDDDGL